MSVSNQQKILNEIESLQDGLGEEFADTLLKLTYKYLDLYYENINQQVRKTYLVLLVFTVLAGLITVAGAIGALFFNLGLPAYATMALGALSEFITSILFVLHTKEMKEMADYWDKLREVQKIALALKAAESLSDPEKSKQIARIIQFLLPIDNREKETLPNDAD